MDDPHQTRTSFDPERDRIPDSNSRVAPLTDAQREDLQRRLDAYQDDPLAGSSWEEVKERVAKLALGE
jgi:putative addiction module component (TIGR02574 family)